MFKANSVHEGRQPVINEHVLDIRHFGGNISLTLWLFENDAVTTWQTKNLSPHLICKYAQYLPSIVQNLNKINVVQTYYI